MLNFKNCIVSFKESHKHLGMNLDKKNSDHHLMEKITKANKGIGFKVSTSTNTYQHLKIIC